MSAVVLKLGAVFLLWQSFIGTALGALSPFHSQFPESAGHRVAAVWPPDLIDASRVDGTSIQAALIDTAMGYLAHTSVPYVWGGNNIGDEATCERCASCIVKNKKRGVRKRHLRCGDCSRCGLDCSHFVQKVFADAGMYFPFVTTASMMKPSLRQPRLIPGLRYVGTDFSAARPGDLLVLRRHVVILVRRHADNTADVIHVSRAVRNTVIPKVGGIEYRRGVNIKRFYGGLRRILRHEKLFGPDRDKGYSSEEEILNTLAVPPAPPGV